MDYKEFFEHHGDDTIKAKGGGCTSHLYIEDLYQAFKARIVDELVADLSSYDETNTVLLVDKQ